MDTEEATQLFLEDRRSRNVTPNTLWGYEWALEKMRQVYPEELPASPRDVKQVFIEHSELAPDSLHGLWRKLRTFWLWIEEAEAGENLMAKIPAPPRRRKLPRTLDKQSIRRLIGAATLERDYAVLALLLDTGIRIGELASMTRDSLPGEGIRVSGKSGDRMVPLTQSVRALVERQGDHRGLWIGTQGVLTISGLQGIVRRNMLKAGFRPPKIGPHTLRHTLCPSVSA